MKSTVVFPLVPASFFGMVIGLSALGGSWRLASEIWPVPDTISEAILLVALALWVVLAFFYAGKWVFARADALLEFHHPVQSCFIGLAGVSALALAASVAHDSTTLAWVLFTVGM